MRILFASTYCLLDTTSGASVSVKILLEQLSRFGFACQAVTASIFDPLQEVMLESVIGGQPSAKSSSAFPHLRPLPEGEERDEDAPKGEKRDEDAPKGEERDEDAPKGEERDEDAPKGEKRDESAPKGEKRDESALEGAEKVVEVRLEGVTHMIHRTASSQRGRLTSAEEQALLSLLDGEIRAFQPDILLTYGGLSTERKMHGLARELGVPVVFYLANGNYRKAETFSELDAIVVPSQFLAAFYGERLGIRCHVLYPIVPGERYRAAGEVRRYVTFTNPAPNKGLSLFACLAAEAVRHLPEAEFLVVEGRWSRENMIQAGVRVGRLANATFLANRADVREVYAKTKVLLFPSFWEEAFGRSIVEAQLNGIPVVASRRGGIPEALNGGGFLLDIPARCATNYGLAPSAEEVRPWLETIALLLRNPEVYEEASGKACAAAKAFDPDRTVGAAADFFALVANKKEKKSWDG
jgi:hypothetical protein